MFSEKSGIDRREKRSAFEAEDFRGFGLVCITEALLVRSREV
jgi:hypothetical protein